MARIGNREVGGVVGKAITKLEESTGLTAVPTERIELLEAYYEDYRTLSRQLDTIGWSVLNYVGGQPQEYSPNARMRVVQQARFVFGSDPQAGASVELMNDFCFGRGIPKPRAKDKLVQEVIDEAWADPDNEEVLTTIDAQLALGAELALTSNLFVLVFGLDEEASSDGKVKLSLLRYDDVYGYVPHPQKRHRVLYYLTREVAQVWDYKNHTMKPLDMSQYTIDPTYYEHWRNVDLTSEEEGESESDVPVELAPEQLVGKGRVYHVRINRTPEQQFGVSRFQRTLTWYSAYNKYVKDRLDIVAAAASLIMKRKIEGNPQQLMRDAAKAISRQSPLALSADPAVLGAPRNAAGIVEENQAVTHEPFNLDTRAGNAQQDAQIIRAPISAAERWSQAYYGDASNSNLATATSLELPILKAVESRQEVFERLVRFFVDKVIERAVDAGRIPEQLTPEEIPVVTPDAVDPDASPPEVMTQALEEAVRAELDEGREIVEVAYVTPKAINGVEPPAARGKVVLLVSLDADAQEYRYSVLESYEDQPADEQSTQRDLSYEFSMPNPLRRMMADLITAVTSIAQTFDPNNTNPKLTRILLTVALGEGLEVQDAPDLVDSAFPEGYVDPLVQAQLDAQAQPQQAAGDYSNADNPYGAPMTSTQPEDMRSGPYDAQQALVETGRTRGRDGSVVVWSRRRELREAVKDLPEPQRRQVEGDRDEASSDFSLDVINDALDGLDRESGLLSSNGNGRQ